MLKKLLCTDLDGTMFPLRGSPSWRCMARLRLLLAANPNVSLCYITGRHLQLALSAMRKYSLPEPDFIITDVGTSIYSKERHGWKTSAAWQKKLGGDWPRGTAARIRRALRGIRGLRSQLGGKQGEFKVSFYLHPSLRGHALAQARLRLRQEDISHTMAISKGRQLHLLLDILPPGASKDKAVRELARQEAIGYSQICFTGDSGNDYSLLASNIKATLVSNAEPGLRRMIMKKARRRRTRHLIYFASGRHGCERGQDVCGLLEGALHYGVFSKQKGMRIHIHSIHGLVNSHYTDLGRDEDTGGQVVYVVELAKALGRLPEIERVDLFTRRILDRKYPNYSRKVEYLGEKARIVRISCGGGAYIKKTNLWPFIDEYVENALRFIEEDGMPPDIIHANYADAGLAGVGLAKRTGAALVFIAHSLGRPKMEKLRVNRSNFAAFDAQFNFAKRIKAEQVAMDAADAIVASTLKEIAEQYRGYRFDRGKFHIIPPGLDTVKFRPAAKRRTESQRLLRAATQGLSEPGKPIILAVSRLDRRKNVPALVRAFCRSRRLGRIANLMVLTGMKSGAEGEQKEIYDELRGIVGETGSGQKVSLVKFVEAGESMGDLYRLAAKSGGVFVNPALMEPFGLTILEASACGLPVIATKHGGPSGILQNGKNGMLIDPEDEAEIERAIFRVLTSPSLWRKLSRNAAKNGANYSWSKAAKKHAELFRKLLRPRRSTD